MVLEKGRHISPLAELHDSGQSTKWKHTVSLAMVENAAQHPASLPTASPAIPLYNATRAAKGLCLNSSD